MSSNVSRWGMFVAGLLLLLTAAGAMIFVDHERKRDARLNDSVREILAQEKRP